ncbi:MAG: DUF6279 family lipoprotein [Rhizobacter sp.]
MLRFAYGQADAFAFRWIDSYVDFDEAQALRVREEIGDWFRWHRSTQLAGYADLVERFATEARAATVTPEKVCDGWGEVQRRLDIAVDRAVPAAARLALSLKPAQLEHLERRYAMANREFREEFLQRDTAKRREEAIKRALSRAEWLYGELDESQRGRLASWVGDSPFDPALALEERQRRQLDLLRMVRGLVAERASPEQAEAEVRSYLRRVRPSPGEERQRLAERIVVHNCRMAADLHNHTSPAQREAFDRRLAGLAKDLRELAADVASQPRQATPGREPTD